MRTCMHVVEFLEKNSLERLTEKYGIVISEYPDRLVLNYDQVSSDSHKFSPIVRECRGLILRRENYKVLCRPFERFFNYGEDPKNKNFPFNEAMCFEKVDGSLVNVYHDDSVWCASTRKMAFAEGPTKLGRTFLQVFEEALGMSVNKRFQHSDFNHEYTYSFELVSPETRVVKPYAETAVYLLNIKDRRNGRDLSNEDIEIYSKFLGIKRPKMYYFNTFEKIAEALKELPAMDEGYVAYAEDSGWRVKIKNPAYLAIAHLRNNGAVSIQRIAELVMSGDYEEYLSYFEMDRPLFQPYIEAFDALQIDAMRNWQQMKDIQSQKEFALQVVKLPCASILFDLRKGKSISESMGAMTKDGKTSLLEKYLHQTPRIKLDLFKGLLFSLKGAKSC